MDSEIKSVGSGRSDSSQLMIGDVNRPKAIEYLSKAREQKESVKDFIFNARQILMA
jgi:hypothetical protein